MLADPNGHFGALIARIKTAVANVVKTMFLNMVNWVAQRPYARRSGKMISFKVSKEYITNNEEDSHNATAKNIVKWTKRIVFAAGGYAFSGAFSSVAAKFTSTLSPNASKALSTVGGWMVGDLEDGISDFIIDSFSIKQGRYTSICATFQYEHKHFIFFTCDNDYATFEIRNYGDTYFELWSSTSGCYSRSIGVQKVGELDIMD